VEGQVEGSSNRGVFLVAVLFIITHLSNPRSGLFLDRGGDNKEGEKDSNENQAESCPQNCIQIDSRSDNQIGVGEVHFHQSLIKLFRPSSKRY